MGPAYAGRVSRKSRREAAPPVSAAEFIGHEIEAVSPSARDPELVRVVVGRKTIATLDRATAHKLRIRQGVEIDESLAQVLDEARARDGARRTALRRLERSGASSATLSQLMQRRGATREIASAVIADLARLGLVDDERFAHDSARATLARRPAGAPMIESCLRKKGISGDLARKAAQAAVRGRDPMEDAFTLVSRRNPRFPAKLDAAARQRRLLSYLARRGFDAGIARRAVERVLGRGGGGYA